ncbi:MAG: class I SAM-dependent rRNA methyltransferase [Candidatus Omnitrophica bacterium]|nr:class I SAM-dependent rRNA methyltransferase [Candidatus Omnitrophota bacterium]
MSTRKNVQLRTGKKGVVKPGHPWIFKSQILKPDPSIKPGDITSVTDSTGKFIGRGYYNPKTALIIRLLTFIDEPIDTEFLRKRLASALEKRRATLSVTNAYRAVFSEADSLPGLIVDVYNDTAVFQVLTLGMEKLKPQVVDVIDDVLKPKYIYEKSVSSFRKIEDLKDITGWWGDEGKAIVEIFEGKTKFLVDILGGHKTGFYLDQRRSRLAFENVAKGKRVLDLFCYTGGFSVTAAVFGAQSVLGVDIKEDWLSFARENAGINGVSDRTEFKKSDAFNFLKEANASGEKFDIIILDPPSFLKSRQSLASASRGYRELNVLAMKALSDGGILATFSCSHNMPNAQFAKVLKDAESAAGKKFTILKRCHQAEDHPIVRAIPETEYLKGYFLKQAL